MRLYVMLIVLGFLAVAAVDAAPKSKKPKAAPSAAPDPAEEEGEEGDSEGEEEAQKAAAAKEMQELAMKALSEPQAPTGPPPAVAAKLGPVLVAINRKLAFDPPLKMLEMSYWGMADADGDGKPELLVGYARGKTTGGVLLCRRAVPEYKVVAMLDAGGPVLRVQALPLAGDKSRQLLVRTGVDEGPEQRRTMQLWAAVGKGLEKVWETTDVDDIAINTDLSKARSATLTDITFEDGPKGKPGTMIVAVTEYHAPKGKGAESTEVRASTTDRYTWDPARGLVKRSSSKGGPEPEATPAPAPDQGKGGTSPEAEEEPESEPAPPKPTKKKKAKKPAPAPDQGKGGTSPADEE